MVTSTVSIVTFSRNAPMKARFFLASVAVTAYRPCVVVSSDEMNAHLHTVIVAPMTTGSPPAAFRITLAA